MALLNKLFNNRSKIPIKLQDNVCDKMFSLDACQVRLVLFCECDFRGRKLLFDSHAVDRIALPEMAGKRMSSSTGHINSLTDVAKNMKKYTEISDGHGYIYTKPNADIYQLGEMIFGSVAMSYRGTTFKIHHMNAPMRIMCTQVFPSPRHSHRFIRKRSGTTVGTKSRLSTTAEPDANICCEGNIVSVSSPNLEQSVRVNEHHRSEHDTENDGEEDVDSGASSSFATSSYSRGHSPVFSQTASDTLLFCRGTPLSVPQMTSESDHRHSIGDSGLTNSFTSFGNACTQSVPLNLNVVNPYITTFSNGSLYRRWLRSASMSLDHSSSSLPGSLSGDDIRPKTVGSRSNKLGLAIIISLPIGQEELLERFLMEHATLIESMVWRARISTETAYRRRRNFVAQLYNTALNTARWLSDLLAYGYLNNKNIRCFYPNQQPSSLEQQHLTLFGDRCNGLGLGDLAFAGLSRLWKTGTPWDFIRNHRSTNNNVKELNKSGTMTTSIAEKCLRDLCELLETIDVKDTNFFVSTFITAILTHHLGWVATALPASTEAEQGAISHLRSPSNPLWGQLTDLYGAIGCPTKIAHTIITGSSDTSTTTCTKTCLNQTEVIAKLLNSVTYFIRCSDIKRNCVSRNDINAENKVADNICQTAGCIPEENYKKYVDHLHEMQESNLALKKPIVPKNTLRIKKSYSCLSSLDKITSKDTCDKNNSCSDLKNNVLDDRTNIKSGDIQNVFSERKQLSEEVVFVLGESDELVGLKSQEEHLAMLAENAEEVDTFPFKDSDFSSINNSIGLKKSQSQSDLTDLAALAVASSSESTRKIEFVRAQSVPPKSPDKNTESKDQNNTPKYKYSGVKFNFQQYPQIVANYMRSKNIELSNLQFLEKAQLAPSVFTAYDFTKYEVDDDFELDALQTPSNATDLEFSADQDDVIALGHKEIKTENNTAINGLKCKSNARKETDDKRDMKVYQSLATAVPCRIIKIVELPMPQTIEVATTDTLYASPIGFANTLLQSTVHDHYIADLVLQGTSAPRAHWESTLRQDLAMAIQHPLLDQPVDEAIAIIANIDTWEVQLMSSHTYVVEKGSSGVTIGMSHLVANMLESLLHMWKLQTPTEHCLMHIEQKLQEFCIRSKALAELLLATDFCSMDVLTSALQLEVNDIPLLMSIASTHSPHIMQKYGLSFQ